MPFISGGAVSGTSGFKPLGKTVLSGASASLDLTGLVATGYWGLLISYARIGSSAAQNSDVLLIRFNGDSTSNAYGMGPGGGVSGQFASSFQLNCSAASVGSVSSGLIYCLGSGGSVTTCFGVHEGRVAAAGVGTDYAVNPAWAGTWATGGVNAITRVTLTVATGPNLVTNGRLAVYGMATP